MNDRSTRQRATSSTSVNSLLAASDENLTLHSIKQLIVNFNQHFESHRDEIKKTLQSHQNEIKQTLDNQNTELKKLKLSLTKTIETEVKKLQTYVDQEIARVVTRIETVETKIQEMQLKQEESDKFSTDVTIVVSGLPFDDEENIAEKVDDLIRRGALVPGIRIVRAIRLPTNNLRPGLIKVQLQSVQDKIRVLQAKSNVKNCEEYRRVFIRSSKTHTERVNEQNIQKLLQMIPEGNKYRLTSNGKLIPRQDDRPRYIGNGRGAHSGPFRQSQGHRGGRQGSSVHISPSHEADSLDYHFRLPPPVRSQERNVTSRIYPAQGISASPSSHSSQDTVDGERTVHSPLIGAAYMSPSTTTSMVNHQDSTSPLDAQSPQRATHLNQDNATQ